MVFVIIAAILFDVNVIVACAILLVIITAYSVKKTTDIAQKQLKLQNDPVISLSLKENDIDVRIIDLVIENGGNGVRQKIFILISILTDLLHYQVTQ